MAQIVQLSETDLLVLSLGKIIIQGISSASKFDQSQLELSQVKKELETIKESLSTEDVGKPKPRRRTTTKK